MNNLEELDVMKGEDAIFIGLSTVSEGPSDETDIDSNSHDIIDVHSVDDHSFEAMPSNAAKPSMLPKPPTVIELTDESDVDESMEQNNSIEANLNEERNDTCSSPSLISGYPSDEAANSHNIESMEHNNSIEKNLNEERNDICTSPSLISEYPSDEAANSHNIENDGSNVINDERFVENDEIQGPLRKQKRNNHLINRSLTLPYHRMSKPEFCEFTSSVAKNLEVLMTSMKPPNFKNKKLPEQSKYQDSLAERKKIAVDEKYPDIVLCEGSSASKRVPSACSNTTKESFGLKREDLIQRLKDQMQKKKEAAFDRHKEIQQADDELCGSNDGSQFNYSYCPSPPYCNVDSPPYERNSSDSDHYSVLSVEDRIQCPTPNEFMDDLPKSEEENKSQQGYDASDFMENASVSLSVPSYQPNGGFTGECELVNLDSDDEDVPDSCSSVKEKASDSCNSDNKKVPIPETNSCQQIIQKVASCVFGTLKVPQEVTSSQVSEICSGRFLSMEEERPWTPSSNSQVDRQMNRKRDLGSMCLEMESEEELEPDKREYELVNLDSDDEDVTDSCSSVKEKASDSCKSDNKKVPIPETNRKRDLGTMCLEMESEEGMEPDKNNYDDETLSPPSKKYKKGLVPDESIGIPSSKIAESMQDFHKKNVSDKANRSPPKVSLPVAERMADLVLGNTEGMMTRWNEVEDLLFENQLGPLRIKYGTKENPASEVVNRNPDLRNYSSEEELPDPIAEPLIDELHSKDEICVTRIKKCRPLSDSSDDEDEKVSDNQQLIEVLPQNQIGDNPVPLKINDFLDEEAELSGDEFSSDESDGDEGDDEEEQEQLLEDLPPEEELKEQVANIHFKHQLDDDARIVKKLKQDFLPEGELHLDGSGRQKTFHWNTNVPTNIQNEILSESEPEDNVESPMLQDKIKWRQETLGTQKHSDSDVDVSDADVKEKTPCFKKLPVSILGRATSSQANFGTNKLGASSSFTRRHGSLIHVAGSEGLNLNVSSSVQRKTVLFRALSHSDEVPSTSETIDGKSVFEKLH